MSAVVVDREDVAAARRQLARDVAGDSLVVLLDERGYRHLRFAFPGAPIGTFELMTWPGRLAVDAPRAHHLFLLPVALRRRRPDAFDLFDLGGDVDPEGWAHLLRYDRAGTQPSDPTFLWCCWAIAHGIAEYRRREQADHPAVAA